MNRQAVDLDGALEQIARVPVLLVASDYDGTIAPIVDDPSQATPDRESSIALRTLAQLPQTYVSIISGRALGDLARITGLPQDVHLVGSHGSEFDLDYATSLSSAAAALRHRIADELEGIAQTGEGFIVERKPAAVAFHYRNASPDDAAAALKSIMEGPATIEGVVTRHGKQVVELSVVATNKGAALNRIRHRVGASAVIFFGDDRTDEDAFATLSGPDVSVKVGEGESRARYRIRDTGDVAHKLARLSELRAAWLAGAEAVPIEQHSMLSDQRTLGLIAPDGRLVWMCLPRLDSPALFAELLGGPSAGYFAIEDDDGAPPVDQHYLDDSLILRTQWQRFAVTDFLDCSGGRSSQRAGRSDFIRLLEGEGRTRITFAPRLDFGRQPTRLQLIDGGLAIMDTHDPIVLRSPDVRWRIEDEGSHQTAYAEVDLTPGEPIVLDLRYGTGSVRETARDAADRCELTLRQWGAWAKQLRLPEIEPDLVRHSAVVLKGLCHGPTGAIAAAATTSLPEHLGGVRNWDYRYCWLRDGAMSAAALVRLGSIAEAMHFLDWVLGVVDSCESPERLMPLYLVNGEALGSEGEIAELAGYASSRPVRVGNGAAQQVQLDVFGPIVDLVALLVAHDAPMSSEHWRLVEAMVHAVERRWQEPDHGIWEIRRPVRHHVHSKVMCWLTVDRGVKIASLFLGRDREDWKALRAAIEADVLRHGYKPGINAFTAAYDDTDLDAAALSVGLSGMLPPDDPRFAGTVAAVERALLDGPTVYRYRCDDGLPGIEGGFTLCTSWLIDSYILMGRLDDARELFDKMIALRGRTSMLSEEYDPVEQRALGNVPQAYSHLGVIENALRLAAATAPAQATQVNGERKPRGLAHRLPAPAPPTAERARREVVTSSPDILGGTPVFAGSRVPVQTLLEYIIGGRSIDEFLQGFPDVSRDQVVAFLQTIGERYSPNASTTD